MTKYENFSEIQSGALLRMAEDAGKIIAPAWPLAATVAVNPFLGHSDESLATASEKLARATGFSATMPRSWYRGKVAAGEITDQDIDAAIGAGPESFKNLAAADIRALLAKDGHIAERIPTIADLSAQASGIDWPGILTERITAWASSFFDEGQAFWISPPGKSVYANWRAYAIHDLTSEILGLKGFGRRIADAPDQAHSVILRATERLGISEDEAPGYYHQLLMSLGGWGQYGRYKLWMAELAGAQDDIMLDLLAIRLAWEEALFAQYHSAVADDWETAKARHSGEVIANDDQQLDALMQEACERAEQRRLANILRSNAACESVDRPAMQVAFCIDVRSEVFRRAVESLNPGIETIGFAGFFGLTLSHRRFASDTEELRLPVLINPALRTRSGGGALHDKDDAVRFKARAKRAWGRFKLAAVSTFAFVEAAGPVYISKLIRDSLGLQTKPKQTDPAPQLVDDLPAEDAVNAAETILRAMSMTEGFARLVILAGHGADVENNPHESALHCGACGGYSGEANARLLAALLNMPDVRIALRERGIIIPHDTLFFGGLHSTTTDDVQIFFDDQDLADHRADIAQGQKWLAAAARIARTERALRLPGAKDEKAVSARSRDWSQTRPEWGLAGCSAFIAAPRTRTFGKDFGGRSFLHSYDWRQDSSLAVLELIMTAPVVVGSWISLQYFGSVTAPEIFGGGNKLLHNVIGGIGVLEGNTGPLRAGLPWQSVHDGDKLMHDPLRLTVCIEAPIAAMNTILERHANVRALFDNRWLHLVALDDAGHMAARYMGDLNWEDFDRSAPASDMQAINLPSPPVLADA